MTCEFRDWWFLNHQVFLLWDQAWKPLLSSPKIGVGRISSKFKMSARELENGSVLLIVNLKWVCVSQGEVWHFLAFHLKHLSSALHTARPSFLTGRFQPHQVITSRVMSPSCSQIPLHQCKFLFVNVLKADCKPLESVLLVPLTSWKPFAMIVRNYEGN